MKIKTYIESTLVLSRDVQNPKPDRRSKKDWRKQPVWKKGTKFIVQTETDHGFLERCKQFGAEPTDELKEIAMHTRIRKRGGSSYYELVARKDDPQGQALLAALKPVEKDLVDLLGDYGTYDGPISVLQQLLDNGTLTAKDIELAVAQLDPDHTPLDSLVMATAPDGLGSE